MTRTRWLARKSPTSSRSGPRARSRLPFFKVKQACLDRFGKTPNNAVEARKLIAGG